jgi:broad specificity phosphatase PhoE
MRLVLVRHGESHHSRRGVIGGPNGCTGLTAQGIEQATTLAARLRATGELGHDVALRCSPWPRARETAGLLAPALPGVVVQEDPGLRELDPGEADGLPWEEYRTRYETFDLQSDPDRPFAPGGESWGAFTARVAATLQRLAEQPAGQTVVAVTHAGFIVAAFLGLFGQGVRRSGLRLWPDDEGGGRREARVWLDPTHTALTEWRVTGTTWHLACYNDASHLAPGR